MLFHRYSCPGVILQSRALEAPLQEQRQILIRIREQITGSGFGDSGGNPLDPVELRPNRIPTFMDAVFLELDPNPMGHMISQYRDEQVPRNAFIFAMINRS